MRGRAARMRAPQGLGLMKRRDFIAWLTGAAAGLPSFWPLLAHGQACLSQHWAADGDSAAAAARTRAAGPGQSAEQSRSWWRWPEFRARSDWSASAQSSTTSARSASAEKHFQRAETIVRKARSLSEVAHACISIAQRRGWH